MPAEATYQRPRHEARLTLAAAIEPTEVYQHNDGRAAVFNAADGLSAGERATLKTDGQYTVAKTAGEVWLNGQPLWWDRSAAKASYKPGNDRDFYLGVAVGDAASADTTGSVNLNVPPTYYADLARDGFASVLVGTAAAGGFGYPVNLGGALVFELTATNEAQKVDALGLLGFAPGANWIVEGCFRVISDGAGAAADVSIGVASATHASDADAIAESVFLHLDANNTNINAESDDGTTEVAATDTTADYTEGSALANKVYFAIDGRDPTSVKVYVNGARVLSGTTFAIPLAAGPLFLLTHLEKTASTDTYKLAIDKLAVRLAEQD